MCFPVRPVDRLHLAVHARVFSGAARSPVLQQREELLWRFAVAKLLAVVFYHVQPLALEARADVPYRRKDGLCW